MPVPYIELKQIRAGSGNSHVCYTYIAKYILAVILAVIGLFLAMGM